MFFLDTTHVLLYIIVNIVFLCVFFLRLSILVFSSGLSSMDTFIFIEMPFVNFFFQNPPTTNTFQLVVGGGVQEHTSCDDHRSIPLLFIFYCLFVTLLWPYYPHHRSASQPAIIHPSIRVDSTTTVWFRLTPIGGQHLLVRWFPELYSDAFECLLLVREKHIVHEYILINNEECISWIFQIFKNSTFVR